MTGSCRFCGQIVHLVGDHEDDEQADHKAVMVCGCEEAQDLQEERKEEAQRIKNREKTLREAKLEIEEIFSRTGTEKIIIKEDVVALIETICILVYDRKVNSGSLNLPYGVQASVTRTAKGNLKINRKDTTAEASEIVA
jgi:hypothetical protein